MHEKAARGACPNCGSGEIVEGRLLESVGVGAGMVFRPKGRGLFGGLFRRDASVGKAVFACCACGLLWTFVEIERLR